MSLFQGETEQSDYASLYNIVLFAALPSTSSFEGLDKRQPNLPCHIIPVNSGTCCQLERQHVANTNSRSRKGQKVH